MTRRLVSVLATALIVASTPISAIAASSAGSPMVLSIAAQTYVDVIGMLESAGYRVKGMKTTLLGRVKILAQNREHLREVVVSRSTGEIKSDRIVRVFAQQEGNSTARTAARKPGETDGTSSSSSGGSGDVSVSAGSGGVSVSGGGISVSVGLGG